MRCSISLLAVFAALAVALAACAGTEYVPKAEPSFYRDLAQPGAVLDDAAAASMIPAIAPTTVWRR